MENGDKLYRERKVKTENYTCSDTVEGEIGRKPCLDTRAAQGIPRGES